MSRLEKAKCMIGIEPKQSIFEITFKDIVIDPSLYKCIGKTLTITPQTDDLDEALTIVSK